ncbi:hypothetical protein Tco_0627176 [Tanacetum coccineum]|uniref:Uncharacterized protein n=1 Tax=Tanacetum coccineum TaxID=301880 RepID=A0ABQ4WLN9_9ASTR
MKQFLSKLLVLLLFKNKSTPPLFADFCKLPKREIPYQGKEHPTKKINSSRIQAYFWMNPSLDHQGGHYGVHYTSKKSLDQDSIGPPSTRMPMTLSPDFPDCEDSRARSIHKSFTSSASFWESSIQI